MMCDRCNLQLLHALPPTQQQPSAVVEQTSIVLHQKYNPQLRLVSIIYMHQSNVTIHTLTCTRHLLPLALSPLTAGILPLQRGPV